MEKLFLLTLCATFFAATALAGDRRNPCTTSEAKQFDFWIGDWNLEWKDPKGVIQTGTNTISKILGGCVIEENFSTNGENPYQGKSHSLFDEKSGLWKQTWVDSGGDYLDFVGEYKDGKMTLRRDFTRPDGKKVKQRMIFSNIKPDSIEWNWESSDDDGKTWKTNWRILYKRKGSPRTT